MWKIRRVRGRSMLPALEPGAVVLFRKRNVEKGDIVLAHLASREVVKRVKNVEANSYYLVGDNRLESTDSRELGPVKKEAIQGVMIMQLPGVTSARKLSSQDGTVMLMLAFVLLLMAVTQLVRFDTFVPLWRTIAGDYWATPLAALVVTIEIFSLPFLLGMKLSHLARAVSFFCGWGVIAFWLVCGLGTAGKQLPLLGSFVQIPSGVVVGIFALLALVMGYITFATARAKR